jgi:septation ring formation regulator EzrA
MAKKNITLDDLAMMVAKGFEDMEGRFDRVDKRFDRIEARMDVAEKDIKEVKGDVKHLRTEAKLIRSELKQKASLEDLVILEKRGTLLEAQIQAV